MKSRKIQKIAGVLCIVMALVIGGFAVRHFFFAEKEKTPNKEKRTDPINIEVYTGNGVDELDREKAKNTMNLKVIIPSNVSKRLKDVPRLKREVEKYLIDAGFWPDVHTATCEDAISENFSTGLQIVSFILDNPASTRINVVIEGGNTYSISYLRAE